MMLFRHSTIIPLRIIAISTTVLTLACSPSQQDEQQDTASTPVGQSHTETSGIDREPHMQNTTAGNQPVSIESSPSTMHASDSAPFAIHTPEMWEVKIARMIAEGNIDAAGAELHRLREEFPEYKINPSILENLNRHYE